MKTQPSSEPSQFTNQTGLRQAQRQTPSATSAIHHYGEALWEHICWLGSKGETFQASTIAKFLQTEYNLAPTTSRQYTAAFIAYCLASPEDFHGPASQLVRVKKGEYRLVDAPDTKDFQ